MLCLCLQVFNKFAIHLTHVLLICGRDCGKVVVVKWSCGCGQVVVWLWLWSSGCVVVVKWSCGCGCGQVVVWLWLWSSGRVVVVVVVVVVKWSCGCGCGQVVVVKWLWSCGQVVMWSIVTQCHYENQILPPHVTDNVKLYPRDICSQSGTSITNTVSFPCDCENEFI